MSVHLQVFFFFFLQEESVKGGFYEGSVGFFCLKNIYFFVLKLNLVDVTE